MYKRGISVEEKKTSFPNPLSTKYGVQVVIGTAPVNLADNPYAAVNKPVKVSGFDEAVAALGYSDDWKSYTLCQSMYASFRLFNVFPVIYINVLDPAVHRVANEQKKYAVNSHQAILEEVGILKDTVIIHGMGEGGTPGSLYTAGKDYILTFDAAGKTVVTVLSSGAAYSDTAVLVESKSIAPEMVKEADIIGALDIEKGTETGLEAIRQIYPKYGVVPGALLAPGWSESPNTGAALIGKCEGISGAFRTECLLDLDTSLTKKYSDCVAVKEQAGYADEHALVLWPRITSGGKTFAYSAVYGAMMSYYTAINSDIPYLYPSNKALNADGAVLADGTEIYLDQVQAGELNGDGIVTVINDNKWKSYGNNTSCYPQNTDPKDRWIGCRRMFSFVANYFILKYKEKLDGNMSRRTIDDIVNSFNIWGNSLMAEDMCAGLKINYDAKENNLEDVLSGHVKVSIDFAPYTPIEYIHAKEEFDLTALQTALSAEE